MDELEFEVTPIGRDDRDVTFASSAGSEVIVPGARRIPLGRRQRLRRAGAVAAILAVVLTGALIIAITPGSRSELGTLVFGTPTPTAPLPFGTDILYFEHAVPWASSNPAVDGKPITLDLRSFTVGFVRVAKGRHTLAYDAPPFAPLRCVFTVPAAKGDSCPLGEQSDINLPRTVKLGRVIDLGGTPTNLPTDQLAALDGAVRAMVDIPQQAAALRMGEHYLTDAGVQSATQPLSATLIFELERDATSGCDVIERCNGNCEYLCVPAYAGSNSGAFGEEAPTNWFLLGHFAAGWHYATTDGTPVTRALAPLVPNGLQLPAQTWSSTLMATWDGSWQLLALYSGQQLTASTNNPTCDVSEIISTLLPQSPSSGSFFAGEQTASLSNPSDGCVVRVIQIESQTGGTLASAVLLYRFGVLLTLDATGSALLPNLPQADAYERALAAPKVATLPALTFSPQA